MPKAPQSLGPARVGDLTFPRGGGLHFVFVPSFRLRLPPPVNVLAPSELQPLHARGSLAPQPRSGDQPRVSCGLGAELGPKTTLIGSPKLMLGALRGSSGSSGTVLEFRLRACQGLRAAWARNPIEPRHNMHSHSSVTLRPTLLIHVAFYPHLRALGIFTFRHPAQPQR